MVNVTASGSPKDFLLEALSNCQTFALPTGGFLNFWQVLDAIHKFIIELHALQCLFKKESNKKQRRDRTVSNFTKVETFHLLWAFLKIFFDL